MYTNKIAGLGVPSLIQEFGSPLYVYDQAVIEQRISELQGFGTIRYAMKALPNLAILALMKKNGLVVDCVSEGELQKALSVGFDPNTSPPEVYYTCDIFDRSSLDFVIANQIPVNAGSIDMIHQYGEKANAKQKEITLRINPGFGHGHSMKTNTGGENSKHGIWHEDLPEALQAANKNGLCIDGLHMHIGSGTDIEHLAKVCNAMLELARKVGPTVTSISAGGGLPIPYSDTETRIDFEKYREQWWVIRDNLSEEFGHPVRLEIEPGRYLVGEAGILISEIRAVKNMGSTRFYLVDAGFNNLARPVMYGAYHRMSICTRLDTATKSGEQGQTSAVVIGGPICESGDIFTQLEGGYIDPRQLPSASVGDYLLIHDAGAYSSSMGSNYNSKPHCAEVLINNSNAHLIRERQPIDNLLQYESIPEHLK